MTQVIKRNLTIFVALIIALTIMAVRTQMTSAQEAPTETTVEMSTEGEETSESTDEAIEVSATTNADVYSFVAQSGDSYTEIARKSVQIYGFENNVSLSGAQIVFIETNLSLAAGSPELNLGESVTVLKAAIAEWVEKANQLTDAQKAAWQMYADRVDFNTDNVGEARN
jgi:hypothetical protein